MVNFISAVKLFFLTYGLDILTAILILVIGIWVARLAANLLQKAMVNSKVNKTLSVFIGNIAYYVILIFVVLVFLEKVGVKTTSFIALIGAAGLAIALALQGSLANFAAGLMIIIFQPFELGDNIETNGVGGVVEEIQIFSTILKTADNKRKIIPNAKITSDIITVDIKNKA